MRGNAIASTTTRLLREPLLHFFLIGLALFGMYDWLHGGSTGSPAEIVVSRGQLQTLQLQFERVWQRPPSSAEQEILVDRWVKEEIFYREGIAMDLDRDDPIIRRRVGQKLEFIVESAAPTSPTDAELQAWLEAHSAEYQVQSTYTLRQVYFDPARHGARLKADIAAARIALQSSKAFTGDETLLPAKMEAVTLTDVAGVFGNEFGERLKTLTVGGWQGPVPSGFGLHLVELISHDVPRPVALTDVRVNVERDLLRARTLAADAAFYKKLRAKYAVRIEDDGSAAHPAG